jgi:flagellar motor switch protein FliG
VLPRALISADKKTLSAVLRNMSKRAAKMLIEDMKYQLRIPKKDIQEAQKKVIDLIQYMGMTGEITVPEFNQNEAGGALSNDEIDTLLAGAD